MIKKLILTISVILPNFVLASVQKIPTIIKIDSASEFESDVVEKIFTSYSSAIKINKDTSNNLSIQLSESQATIESLILELQGELGDCVKIEKISSYEMKKGTQDGEWGK